VEREERMRSGVEQKQRREGGEMRKMRVEVWHDVATEMVHANT
jgi:hypothetical protein